MKIIPEEKETKLLGSARSKVLLVQIFQISRRFLTGVCKRSCRLINNSKSARDLTGNLKIVKSRKEIDLKK